MQLEKFYATKEQHRHFFDEILGQFKLNTAIPYGIFCWTDTGEQRPVQLQGQLFKRWVVIHTCWLMVSDDLACLFVYVFKKVQKCQIEGCKQKA